MNRTHRLFVALGALAIAAAACGKADKTGAKPDDTGKGPAVVLLAADQTVKAGSSKIEIVADIDAGDQSMTMKGEGAFDYARTAGFLTMRFEGIEDAGEEAAGLFQGFEMRFVDGIAYMKLPEALSSLAPGLKPWVKIDVEELTGGAGLNGLTSQDPTSMLAFTKAAKDIKEVGTARVRGEKTTHFKMTIDMAKALEAVPEEARAQVKQLVDTTGIKEMPMDLWVDSDGRVRRWRFTMDFSKIAAAAGSPGEGSMTMTAELFDFGTPVSVTAPPADQVGSYADLQKLGSQ